MQSVMPTVLLVEDNPADQLLAREAFKSGGARFNPVIVDDGQQAYDFLKKRGDYAEAPSPDLVILDLNLPRMDGRELLEKIRRDPQTQRIPVVVLSSSESHQDIRRCYDLRCNSYVHKPDDLDEYFEAMRSIEQYWFKTSRLPS